MKYILIIAFAFAGYEYVKTAELRANSTPKTISSTDYNFQVTLPGTPKNNVKMVNIAEYGKIKSTSYTVNHSDLTCTASITHYVEQVRIPGDFYDQVDVAKRDLIDGFGGTINHEGIVYNGRQKGYEFNLRSRNNLLVRSQIYKQQNNLLNLMCQYPNEDDSKLIVDNVMQSLAFS
ncbi:hypothetical protein ACFOD0_08800 [Shewanella intestini]|uniref:DUF1795 domain-containing protein n=1 Tax=Shewanella intestini TaxID=2017544 RepID=A0ABS5HYV9_9GAMM|nr:MULTISPECIES: hypothetical protein [Shewanella]MBR9726977.1 hypothetical protein [Shewanella intestini]MRG34457.1 hypothetical protein [Shewanella sp. XMDDZSB0408]